MVAGEHNRKEADSLTQRHQEKRTPYTRWMPQGTSTVLQSPRGALPLRRQDIQGARKTLLCYGSRWQDAALTGALGPWVSHFGSVFHPPVYFAAQFSTNSSTRNFSPELQSGRQSRFKKKFF